MHAHCQQDIVSYSKIHSKNVKKTKYFHVSAFKKCNLNNVEIDT